MLPEDTPVPARTAASQSGQLHPRDALANKTEALSKRTRTKPTDVAAWLGYVQHQQDVARGSGALSSSMSFAA